MAMSTTYFVYLVVSFAVTVWVGRRLHGCGRAFLVDTFGCQEKPADAVNEILLVGYYLLNFGFVALSMKYGVKPAANVTESLEFLSTKIGLVLVILGVIHFFNLFVFTLIARAKRRQTDLT